MLRYFSLHLLTVGPMRFPTFSCADDQVGHEPKNAATSGAPRSGAKIAWPMASLVSESLLQAARLNFNANLARSRSASSIARLCLSELAVLETNDGVQWPAAVAASPATYL